MAQPIPNSPRLVSPSPGPDETHIEAVKRRISSGEQKRVALAPMTVEERRSRGLPDVQLQQTEFGGSRAADPDGGTLR